LQITGIYHQRQGTGPSPDEQTDQEKPARIFARDELHYKSSLFSGESYGSCGQQPAIFLDFAKAFDKVPRARLLKKV
jgi:hypothetical protein